MRVYIVTQRYECVQFKDLSEDLKEKVVYEHYEPLLWGTRWWDRVLEKFKEDRKEEGVIVESDKVYFDLSYTQHHGAVWSGYLYSASRFLRVWEDQGTRQILMAVMKRGGLEAIAKAHGCCYQEALVRDYLNQEDVREICEELNVTEVTIENALEEFEAFWEYYCEEKARELLSTLEMAYEEELKEEHVNDFYEANNIVFDIKTGKPFWLDGDVTVKEVCYEV